MKKILISILSIGLYMLPCLVESQDTIRRHTLPELQVSTNLPPSETYTSTPTQVLTAADLEKTSSTQLSDAVRQLSGITLKDFGGIGGIKTMSARGLGSQFSSLAIDGITVSDCQNGQIDLGRYLLGNSAYLSFSNGQHDTPLQSARAYAAGNIVNLETHQPEFREGEWYNIHLGMEAGSYNMYAPTLTWEHRINDRLSYSIWGNYLTSKGDYPFTLYYTATKTDSSSVEKRQNSEMWMATGDANIFYNISTKHYLTAKVHYMQGRHNLPGPVIYYSAKASEHSTDQLFFTQAKYRFTLPKFHLQVLAKYQLSHDTYTDTAANNLAHYLHNDYLQHEGYLSEAMLYQPIEGLKLTLSADQALNSLESNLAQNNQVLRFTSTNVLAATYDNSWVSASANLLATLATESAQTHDLPDAGQEHAYRKLSPYAGINIKPFRNVGLRLRYFFKENYRIPNFNEMYYFVITRNLNPEKALQHNVGITFIQHHTWKSDRSLHIQATADAYYNRVTDKLIAIPTQNMFLWSMMNLGRVDIHGVDSKIDFSISWGKYALTIGGSYAYQQALDCTDSTSKTFHHQIPYTPRHSGAASLYFESPYIDFGYSVMAVGARYSRQQNTAESLLPSYCDQSVTLAHTFTLANGSRLKLKAQVLNLFNVQYEVVRNYPMMGRNYRLSVNYDF